MRVGWTERAYTQLEEAMGFIARDRPGVAAEYRLVYRRDAQTVTIVAVVHERREFNPKDDG